MSGKFVKVVILIIWRNHNGAQRQPIQCNIESCVSFVHNFDEV